MSTISNERISFTSLVSQALPAAIRWKERESAVFGATVQQGHASALPSLNTRHQPAEILLPVSRPPAVQPLVRRMDHFNQPLVVWRLISGNHRELGRGVGLFPNYQAAAANATLARDGAGELAITFVYRRPTREFGWYASLWDRPVLMASVWYPTIRDRDRSALAALDLFGGARLLSTVIRHGHRHLGVELPAAPAPADSGEQPPAERLATLSP
ncbi:MAG: hypothetical protein NTU93_09260 [Arthrobacter sp.]|nr:hypothetical protein [Arthrobacter sp.]